MELGETQLHSGFGRNRVKLAGQEAEVGKCVWNQGGLYRGYEQDGTGLIHSRSVYLNSAEGGRGQMTTGGPF